MLKISLKNIAAFIAISLSTTSNAAYDPAKNPFKDSQLYVNPDFVKEVQIFLDTYPDYKAKAKKLELLNESCHDEWKIPTAIWLDSKHAITGYTQDADGKTTTSMLDFLKNAAQRAAKGPVTITFVVYDLPLRDCAAYSSNGEFKTASDLENYKTTYIGPNPESSPSKPTTIVDSLNAFYNDNSIANKDKVQIVLIIEPDSLPNMITNVKPSSSNPVPPINCVDASKNNTYYQGITYALKQFTTFIDQGHPIYMYLDIAHSGWMGWDLNFNQFSSVYNADKLGSGFKNVHGFISNTANYTPEKEVFSYSDFTKSDAIRQVPFYQWTYSYDEYTYIANLLKANQITNENQKHFLIDTSRNGWIINTTDFHDHNGAVYSRKDQRHHRGNWCNIQNILPLAKYKYEPTVTGMTPSTKTSSGLGFNPSTDIQDKRNPLTNSGDLPIEAFVWIKPPYESDGNSVDQMCGDGDGGSHNDNLPTDALQNNNGGAAPHAGAPFDQAFKNLIDVAGCYRNLFSSAYCPNLKAK